MLLMPRHDHLPKKKTSSFKISFDGQTTTTITKKKSWVEIQSQNSSGHMDYIKVIQNMTNIEFWIQKRICVLFSVLKI